MKLKIFTLVAIIIATVSSVNAQDIQVPILNAKYQGEVQVGFGAGVGMIAMDRIYLHTIQGVKIGHYFSTGLGLGLNYIPSYTFEYNKPELFMPIYLNFKGFLPVNQKTSLFASFDIGCSFGVTAGVSGLSGLLITPAVGVSIDNKLNLSLGYDAQKLSTGVTGISVNIGAIALKAAIKF